MRAMTHPASLTFFAIIEAATPFDPSIWPTQFRAHGVSFWDCSAESWYITNKHMEVKNSLLTF